MTVSNHEIMLMITRFKSDRTNLMQTAFEIEVPDDAAEIYAKKLEQLVAAAHCLDAAILLLEGYMKLRDKGMITLVHGKYYKGECRNATVARWNADEQQFYYWRHKWGQRFVETIGLPDIGNMNDVFVPEEMIENPEEVIPFEGE